MLKGRCRLLFPLSAGLFAAVRGLGVKSIALACALGLGFKFHEAARDRLFGLHSALAAVGTGYCVQQRHKPSHTKGFGRPRVRVRELKKKKSGALVRVTANDVADRAGVNAELSCQGVCAFASGLPAADVSSVIPEFAVIGHRLELL